MKNKKTKLLSAGDFFIWMSGIGLAAALFIISGFLLFISLQASDYYWLPEISEFHLKNAETVMGVVTRTETAPFDSTGSEPMRRYLIETDNSEMNGAYFVWISDDNIAEKTTASEDAVLIEREANGNFIGYIQSIKDTVSGSEIPYSAESEEAEKVFEDTQALKKEITEIWESKIFDLNYSVETLRNEIKEIEYQQKGDTSALSEATAAQRLEIAGYDALFIEYQKNIDSLKALANRYVLSVSTADGRIANIPLYSVYSISHPNSLSFFERLWTAAKRVYAFITTGPRESNTEGGIFPALFGTVTMVLFMTILVMPFGIAAALYMHEYAGQGRFVNAVRIAIHNLAGVPSIVYGVFGLGFFIYFIGGTIDNVFYPERLPSPTWGTGGLLWAALTLALLTLPVVVVSTEEALSAVPRGMRESALALGATRWQMIYRIILPAATPGILTGMILAVARAAGEAAPLMITGVVKLAPVMPVDSHFPFFHLERKFMYLSYHVYDTGFQSPNVEAALPMVYMTSFVLIAIVLALSGTAIWLRARLRSRYKSDMF